MKVDADPNDPLKVARRDPLEGLFQDQSFRDVQDEPDDYQGEQNIAYTAERCRNTIPASAHTPVPDRTF